MHINWLKDLISLSESESFSTSALQRFTSQPALSRRIRQLEEWVGEELIDRRANHGFLTQAGEAFLPYAKNALQELDNGAELARVVSKSEDQQLRIAITHALSLIFFPDWFGHLGNSLNASSVQLMSDTANICLQRFLKTEVQFCIAYAEHLDDPQQHWQTFQFKVIGNDKLVAVYQPEQYALIHSDLSSAPLLFYSEESGLSRYLRASSAFQHYHGKHTPYLCAPNASVLKSLTLKGLGIAWLPQSLIHQDLASGALRPVPHISDALPLEIRLYRQSISLNTTAEALWSSL